VNQTQKSNSQTNRSVPDWGLKNPDESTLDLCRQSGSRRNVATNPAITRTYIQRGILPLFPFTLISLGTRMLLIIRSRAMPAVSAFRPFAGAAFCFVPTNGEAARAEHHSNTSINLLIRFCSQQACELNQAPCQEKGNLGGRRFLSHPFWLFYSSPFFRLATGNEQSALAQQRV